MLGIGSGQVRSGAVELVTDAAAALRRRTDARVVVGALGPRMRRAGGRGIRWGPAQLAHPAGRRRAGRARRTRSRRRPTSRCTCARPSTTRPSPRLDEETARYAGYPAYAANFARLGVDAADTVIRPAELRDRIAAYRAGVDEVVLRAITPTGSADDHLRFIDAIAEAVA